VEWANKTKKDLSTIHNLIKDNGPLLELSRTTNYVMWLNEGYKQALEKSKHVSTYGGYLFTLKYYIAGFRDYHTNIMFKNLPSSSTSKWPGFIVAMRDGSVVVVYKSSKKQWKVLPPIGAKLVSCNGKKVADLLEKNIYPYWPGAEKYPSTWDIYVPYLFFDQGNPWALKLNQCKFIFNNQSKVYKLNWLKNNSKNLKTKLRNASFGARVHFAIKEFGKNSVWISIPTFSWAVQENNQIKILKKQGETSGDFLTAIAKAMPKFRNKNIIVFDLRGNPGGAPIYARNILFGLYTKEYLSSLGTKFVWNRVLKMQFRVTKRNLDYLKAFPYLNNIAEAMEKAMDSRQSYMTYSDVILNSHKKINNPVKGKVIYITDGHCGSMCTMFSQALKEIPGTIQLGAPTAKFDASGYNNDIVLPSKLATLEMPIEAVVSPKDYMYKPIIPDVNYSGYLGNTKNLKDFILKKYERGEQ
tara:strand:+ start:1019 stop:2425 length:1407 start_codon:yes stop_codon:yes gene_type:complete